VPIPAFANETTTTTTTTTTTIPEGQVVETETFDGGVSGNDQTTDIIIPEEENNNLVNIDDTWSGLYGMDGTHIELEYQKHSGASNDYTFTLPEDHDIYEVGFVIGAVNNAGTVEYTHSDDTTQTNDIDAQTYSNNNTMWEEIVYNTYDQVDLFIDKFVITIKDWSLVDDIEIKYINTTTTTLDPLTIQRNANFASYGISETDEEKGIREEEEAIIVQQQIEYQQAVDSQMEANAQETGIYETDYERGYREATEIIVVVLDDGSEGEYTQNEINDGTIDRENQRAINEELYGVALTDEQIERGDLEDYGIEIIEEDIYEEEEQFIDDDDILDIEYIELEDEGYIELTEEELLELEAQMEREAKELEYEQEIEFFEFESEEKAQEFIDTLIELEEIDLEIYEVEIFEDNIVVDEVDWIDIYVENDLFPPTEEQIREDLLEVQDEEIKKNVEEVLDESVQETIDEDIVREVSKEQDLEPIELTEEEVAVELAEIEEVIVIEIEIATEEEIEEFTEEELVEYEEAKEEAIQEYVQDLTNEEASEVLEEVNDIGVQNLEQASEQVQEIVQAVVEESIADVEDLTQEQVEVVAEVLQVQAEDVEIIAESVKDDEVIAEAVEEYVERAVENSEVENYTLADVVVEVQIEAFIENPIGILVDVDLSNVVLSDIGNDMTQDQKEKAQEVVVPVILTRIASMAAFIFRKS